MYIHKCIYVYNIHIYIHILCHMPNVYFSETKRTPSELGAIRENFKIWSI